MLKARYTPRIIPSRTGACVLCGTSFQTKTFPRKFCDECAAARKLASARKAMEKQRRKRGVVKVKGTEIPCRRCGTSFIRNGIVAKFCPPCGQLHYTEEQRRKSQEKRNTEDGRAYLNAWMLLRRKTDPGWRVSSHMRTMIHRGLRGGKQGRSWREFVPYSLEELMLHIERQFTDGMCWEKMGSEIHIDHIIPLSSFKFDNADHPEFKAAWAITNLRPLWAGENIRKSGKRTHLI